jgi:hypothetical protein
MKTLRAIALGLLVAPSLSSCWLFVSPPPPYVPPISLALAVPNTPESSKLLVGLFAYDTDKNQSLVAQAYGLDYYVPNPLSKEGTPFNSQTSMPPVSPIADPSWIYGNMYFESYSQRNIESNAKVVTLFARDESADTNVPLVISNPNVKTADLYIIAWREKNNDGVMNNTERVYYTGDRLSYATDDFTYSYTGKTDAGTYTESGTRKKGWSLVRRSVYSSGPKNFRITMNSSDTKNYTVKLHEAVDFFSSMSSMNLSSMNLSSMNLSSMNLGGAK